MSHKRKFLGGLAALALTAALPAAALAQTAPDATSQLLIAILVKKGVISQADANAILQEATQEAALAATNAATSAPPAPTGETASSSTGPDGTIHVTYVPKIVREQIAQQVTQQVLQQEQVQGYAQPDQIPGWVNRIKFYGDFRTRYESDLFPRGNDNQSGAFSNFNSINTGSPYDISSANNNYPAQINVDQNRNRFRIRARLGVTADLGDDVALNIRFATGENDSPVSENQTLGGAPSGAQGGDFSKYQLWIDRAALIYTPDLGPDTKATLSVGRFDNPFFSTNLIFADDLGFDGVAASGSHDFGGVTAFLTTGAFPIYDTDFNFASNQPAKYPSRDKWLFGAQAGASFNMTQTIDAKLGLADYGFTNISGKLSAPCTVLTTADSCSTDSYRPAFAQNGNTYMALRDIIPTAANNFGTTAQYQYFGLASNFNEVALTGHIDFNEIDPAHVWLDGELVDNAGFARRDIAAKAVNNRALVVSSSGGSTAIGTFNGGNQGYYFNASVGHQKLEQTWDWNFSLGYKYLESDAVLDGLTDSDFGLGGTNLKGYIIGGNVALNPKIWVRLRYLSADDIAGSVYKADVFQLDLNGKF